jgi:hypothetical protein
LGIFLKNKPVTITGVLGQRLYARISTCQVQPVIPILQIKRVVIKGRQRRFIMWHGYATGKGREHFITFSEYRHEL